MNLKQILCTSAKPLAIAALAFVLAGCASRGVRNPSGVGVTVMRPDERGFVAGTGVESQDIVAVTEKIARTILSTPELANAQGIPRIVLLPVENNTRFRINSDIFLTRIRAQLNEKALGRVRFLDRENMAALERERALKQSGQVTSNTDPNINQFRGADFFLTGQLDGLTTRTSRGTSDYVLYTFRLVDPNTSDIIYEGSYEMKKQGLEDAAYR